ncbi:Spo0B domain-containing protein [Paenibacillus tarimensis]|uniref:Spo0B domain-containing protein n=1 Tax=Paenibacillus tarimensis TaxID=416012 RepID=UPI001F3EBBD3|nr:Spo0B domain-containing protein [Paenibacillus tarimensis]MCF2943884.1 Spo0B domain-containing protein [Paenibacillus tarimensis]
MEHFKHALEVAVLLSVPQAFSSICLVMVFFGLLPRKLVARTLSFSITLSVSLNFSFMSLETPVHMLFSIALTVLMMYLFFNRYSWRIIILLAASFLAAITLSELAGLMFTSLFIPYELLITGPFYYKFILWPFFSLFLLMAWFMHRYSFFPGKRAALLIAETRDSNLLLFILLITAQLIILFVFYVSTVMFGQYNYQDILFIAGILSILAVTGISVKLLLLSRKQAVERTRTVYVGDLLQLFTAYRSQRHDFVNHVQTMHAMLQLNKRKQLEAYMEEVVEDIQALSEQREAMGVPALAALIQAKSALAADHRISMQIQIGELPKGKTDIRMLDMIGIIGQLIDMVLEEMMKLPYNLRQLELAICEQSDRLLIRITKPADPYAAASLTDAPGLSPAAKQLVKQIKKCHGELSIKLEARNQISYHLHFPLFMTGLSGRYE